MGEARLWTGGRVFTGRRYVEALLVEDGAVVAAGSEPDVRREAPTGTEVVPLGGRLVIPGLIDAHLHLSDLTRFREGLDLTEVHGAAALEAKVRGWAASHAAGAIVGRGLDVDRSLGGQWPDLRELDRWVPDRSLVLYHTSGHAAMVNGVALAEAGIEGQPSRELEGRVGQRPDGTPNGILYEEALRWIAPLAAVPLDAPSAVRTLEGLAAFGLTTVATLNVPPEELVDLRAWAAERRYPVRVRVYVRLLRLKDIRPADIAPVGPSGSFGIVGAKGFTDGAFGPRTAWLSAPYADAPEGSGLAVESDEVLASALARAAELGLAPALHAIGDRAIVRAARLLAPYVHREGARARVEHAGLTPPAALSVLAQVRPTLVVQPGFVWSDSWLPQRLGPDRDRWAYAFRTLADLGLRLVGSSDAPYDPPDPWRGLRAAVQRRDALGRSANPHPGEALAVEEAVRMYGADAGAALGEGGLGSLEVGSAADLVLLDVRGLDAAIRTGASSVRETWVGGRRVHDAGAGAPGPSR